MDGFAHARASLKVLVVVLLPLVGGATLTASAVSGATEGDAVEQQRVDRGRLLYGRDCVSCHGADGLGSFRGPSLDGLGAAGVHYAVSTGRMPIASPDAEVRRRDPTYSRTEIDALVAYAATLVDGPGVPEVDTAGTDLSRGGDLYRLNCASCHSSTGIGGGLAFGENAPDLFDSTPVHVAEAMLLGPGAMPAFTALAEEDIAAVAAYVEYLQDPPRRGIPVFGGRVGEGAVAWLLGVVLLVFAARWIGKRA